ncbi:MAG: hypothetical protein ABMA13_06495 [Chthoniobacteraceae bacterium]
MTSWSGNTDLRDPKGMPPEVAKVHAAAAGTIVKGNIKCFILTPDGEVEAVFNAFPNNDVSTFGFNSDEAGRFFADSVRHFASELKIPETANDTSRLALPTTLQDGTPADARLLLHISPRSQPSQYRAAVAEPLRLGPELRAALSAAKDASRTVAASSLAPVLNHFYPPAIMQNTGRISAVSGDLALTPIGANRDGAWAKLTGTATLTLDDGADTKFPVLVDALVVTDAASGAFKSVRGILEGTCPKVPFGNGRGRTHQIEMIGTFASFDAR